MLDIKFIRDNEEAVKEAAHRKGVNQGLVDELLKIDESRRELIQATEAIRSEQKKIRDPKEGSVLKEKFKKEEEKLRLVEEKFRELMVQMPNIISSDTPVGKDEEDNKEVCRWGDLKEFSFKPKDHMELAKKLDILDFERGVKVAGFRGYYLKNDGVLLAMGLMMYAVNKMVQKGFQPMIPPTLVKGDSLFGTGYFKGLEYDPEVDEIYQVATSDKEASGEASKDKKFLVGTAEPSLLAYHSGEILNLENLPLKLSGYSQCYRSEIGSYGKDVKGLYRVHEFMKVEQVVFAPADINLADKIQEEMIAISGEMHEELGLPYRRLLICTGDLSLGKYRQYDTEAWLPGMKRWGETGSASSFLDWQSRRLNVRYTDENGDKKFVYMLNNTALPTPRVLIAILENNQNEDGTITVPKVLVPYVGREVIS